MRIGVDTLEIKAQLGMYDLTSLKIGLILYLS